MCCLSLFGSCWADETFNNAQATVFYRCCPHTADSLKDECDSSSTYAHESPSQAKPPRRFDQRIAKELIVRLGSENSLPVAAALKLSRESSCTTACAQPCETASPMQGRGVLRLTGDDKAGEAGHLFGCC
jgi:hypothetical protein